MNAPFRDDSAWSKHTQLRFTLGFALLLGSGLVAATLAYSELKSTTDENSQRLSQDEAHQAQIDRSIQQIEIFMAKLDGHMDMLMKANGVDPSASKPSP